MPRVYEWHPYTSSKIPIDDGQRAYEWHPYTSSKIPIKDGQSIIDATGAEDAAYVNRNNRLVSHRASLVVARMHVSRA
jgi:hypothetical protein